MKDYEQLYYDSIYKIKQLKKEISNLEYKIQIYKSLHKNSNVKEIIITDLIKYINDVRSKIHEK